MPSIDAHSRLGVVERRQFDALGATAFICSCVGAFYDLYRQDRVSTASVVVDTIDDDDTRVAEYLEENGFYAYPDFYTFQAAAEPVDYRWFDIWPDHKQVHVETDPEPALRAINDRAITTLLVPNESPSPPSLDPETRESAARRIESCYLYSPDGDLDDPDASIRIETDSLEEWIEATVDTVDADPDGVRDERAQYWRNQLANQPLEQDLKRIDLNRAFHYLPGSDC